MSTLNVEGIKNTSAANNAITLATDGTCTAKVTNRTNRNLLYNSDMRIAQRGTSAVTLNTWSGQFAVDRWRANIRAGKGTITAIQDSTVPTGEGFKHSLKLTQASTATAASNDAYMGVVQHLEMQDIWHLAQGTSGAKSLTLSFWVKSSVNGTYAVVLTDGTFNNGIAKEYTISNSNWKRVVLTFPGDTGGVADWTAAVNARGLVLGWDLGSGSDYQIAANAWTAHTQSGSPQTVRSSTNQVRWIDTSGATFYITGIQLEVGDYATEFEHKSFADELSRCQRYYQEIQGSDGTTLSYLRPLGHSGPVVEVIPDFLVPMRANPTVTFTGTIHCRACAENTTSTTITLSGSSFETPSTNITTGHFWCNASSGTPFTAGYSGRIKSGAAGSSVNFSAEL